MWLGANDAGRPSVCRSGDEVERAMSKATRVLGLLASIAAFGLVSVGCAAQTEPSRGELDSMEHVAAAESALNDSSSWCTDDQIDFFYTEIAPSQYVFYQGAPIDASLDACWEPLSDFEELVNVVLPGIATDF